MNQFALRATGPLRSSAPAFFLVVLAMLASCGGGGSSPPAELTRDPLQVTAAKLAPGVIELNSATDELTPTELGVFTTRSTTPMLVGTVFMRDNAAYKVALVDTHSDGTTTIFTESASLKEVYSDLRIYGWIDATLMKQAVAAASRPARPLATGAANCISAAKSTPTGVLDVNKFAVTIGFSNCALDTTEPASLVADGKLEIAGSVLIDLDLAAGTFLFTPSTDLKLDLLVTVGQKLEKQFPEFVLLPINVPPGLIPVPLHIDFGLQVGAKASGGLSLKTGGTLHSSPGRLGYLNGSRIAELVPDVSVDAITFNPLNVSVDASLSFEPFVAVAIGTTIGPPGSHLMVNIARFRLLAGIKADMGAQLSSIGGTGCLSFALSPVASGDFSPARFEIGSIFDLGFDKPFEFFRHEWEPIFPNRTAICAYGPTARIDVALPSPILNAGAALVAVSGPGLTLSASSSKYSAADPITAYSWTTGGLGLFSRVNVMSPTESSTVVNADGLKEGEAATVVLTVTTRGGNKSSTEITLIGNRAPTAAASVTVADGVATLNGSASSDIDGRLVRWKWVLPDGRRLRQIAAAPVSLDASAFTSTGLTTLTVTDDAGVDSAPIQISPVFAPIISGGPDNVVVDPGQTATFSVISDGSAPLSFQWRRAGIDILGATASSYTTAPLALVDSGSLFTVSVSNAAGTTVSHNAAVTVRAPAGGPDLAAYSLAFSPASVSPAAEIQVQLGVINQGSSTAAASTAVVRINQSSTSPAGTNLASISVPSLGAGASAGMPGALVTVPSAPGTYQVWVVLDNYSTAGQSGSATANDYVLASGSLTVGSISAAAFADNFDRPDGAVGNGWINAPDNVSGNLAILGNRLANGNVTGNSRALAYRSFNAALGVAVSGTLTDTAGAQGRNRYESAVWVGSLGTYTSGLGLYISRSQTSFNNSAVFLYLNGVKLASISSPVQYGTSIDFTILFDADGRVHGTVTSGGTPFNFDFGTSAVRAAGLPTLSALPGGNVTVELESVNGIPATMDNFSITSH